MAAYRLVLMYVMLLLLGSAFMWAQESFDEQNAYAEYVMFGYPRLEGSRALDELAARLEPWSAPGRSGSLVRESSRQPHFSQRTYDVANQATQLVLAFGMTNASIGPLRVGLIGHGDLLSLFPDDITESSFSSGVERNGDLQFLSNGRVSSVHSLGRNWGVSGHLGLLDIVDLRFEYERALFEHGLVSGVGAASVLSEIQETTRERIFAELSVRPSRLFAGGPGWLPDTLGIGLISDDNLSPEGFTTLVQYRRNDLGWLHLSGGYGEFRQAAFADMRWQAFPIASVLALEGEYRRNSNAGPEITRAFYGIEYWAYAQLLSGATGSLREWMEANATESSTVSIVLGLEYANTPEDIETRFDLGDPPAWALWHHMAGISEFAVFYYDLNISGFLHLFSDPDNPGTLMRFGVFLPR